MPKWMTAAFTLFLCLHVFSTEAHTVDEVISNYVHAMGGRDRLKTIKSLYMEGVAVMPNGSHINIKTSKIHGTFCKQEISSENKHLVYLITDKKALVSDSKIKGKFRVMPGAVVKYLQGELDCTGALVDYAAKGYTAALAGKENVEGIECYKIALTLNSGEKVYYFIDTQDWLIRRETRKSRDMMIGTMNDSQENTINVDYSDYRKIDGGYVFPYTVKFGNLPANMTYKTIEINARVESALPGE